MEDLGNVDAIEDKFQEGLEGQKVRFLAVDDIWRTNEKVWKCIESSLVRTSRFTRGRVLITTPSFDVARKTSTSQAHELKDLGNVDAWELFKKFAFANKTREQCLDLEDVGRRILGKCRGLPLAIRTLGALLKSKNDRSQWESIEKIEIWGLSLEQSNVMPWLLISFYHLPNAAIKQCFVHCSIVIEKGTFVLQSEVIQVWMAQGFIQTTTESEMSMEDVGETYVSSLLVVGLLQVDIRNDDWVSWKYDLVGHRSYSRCYLWMHDLVHDLARFISKDTIWIPTDAYDLHTASEADHILFCGEGSSESEYNLPKGKTLNKLRTLICSRITLSIDFAAHTKFVRDLRLIGCGLKEVPSIIGRLKHLMYLSLSGNPLSYLSESISTLFNLQTLDVEECYMFDELPIGITMLVNLRHILTSKAMKMPREIGKLIRLRTLPQILLQEKKGFEIKELKSLAFLSGDVAISGLEHVSCKEDVVGACLKTKSRIRNLRLWWGSYKKTVSCDEEIMKELQPHSDLKGIVVRGFGGKRLSSWLLYMNHIKTIELRDCNPCEQLPALGQLGSLEEIYISGMESLEVIGEEFYYTDKERATTSCRKQTMFPKLKCLCLADMQNLRDWVQPSISVYEVFPCLEKLQLWGCPSIFSAPTCFHSLLSLSIRSIKNGEPVMMILTSSSNLTDLEIYGSEHLTSLSHPLMNCSNSLKTLVISKCGELVELGPTFQCMTSLEKLEVRSCDSLAFILDIGELLSLLTLEIWNCPNLDKIYGLESCVSLKELHLKGNSKLGLIPDLKNLTRLTMLRVDGFSRQMWIPEWLSCLTSLRELKIGGFSKDVEQLDVATHLPKCLKELTLYGWPKLSSLPSELQYLNQLEELIILSFERIETLPEWLAHLSSLKVLYIDDCKKLKYLPSLEAMRII